MNAIKKLITFSFVFLVMTAAYADIHPFKVTASELNVRKNPMMTAPIVEVIPRDKKVYFQERINDWVSIKYFSLKKDSPAMGGYSYGWVSADYIDPQTEKGKALLENYDCKKETKSGANICLSLTNSIFNCKDRDDGLAFEYCYTNIDYNLSTEYQGSERFSVWVDCKTKVTLHGTAGRSRMLTKSTPSTEILKPSTVLRARSMVKNKVRGMEIATGELQSTECTIRNIKS